MESSLKALIFEVSGTCGPRQKSMNLGPRVYSVKTSPAFSVDELAFHPGFGVFLQAFAFGCRTRS